MIISVTGATGFLGSRLVARLIADGHSVRALGRRRPPNPAVHFYEWPFTAQEPPAEAFADADAVIHLAGEPVSQRWTPEVKKRIRMSRAEGTRQVVNALSIQSRRPRVLVSGSAIGIYGPRGDEVLTEDSDVGDDFLARVSIEWEQAAEIAGALGIRVACIRTGLVLHPADGVLARMLPPFRYGFGGKLASGDQWMSWIHIDDWIALVLFAIQSPNIAGPVNASAPNPVTNAQFTRDLAHCLHRPAILPLPKFALKLALGEMAEAAVASQRALPKAALAAGFRFQYPTLPEALGHLLSASEERR